MKKTLIITTLIGTLSASSLLAQRTTRSHAQRNTLHPFTVKASIGSGISNLNDFRHAYGGGPNANASFLYMFSKHFGVEAGGTFSFPETMEKPSLLPFDISTTNVRARHSAAFVNAVAILNRGHKSNFLFRMGVCRGLQAKITESADYTYQSSPNMVYSGTAVREVKTENKFGFCTSAGYSYEVYKGLRLNLDMNIVFLHAPYVSSTMNSFLVNGDEKLSVLNTREKEILYKSNPRTDTPGPSEPTEQKSAKAHLGYISLAFGLSYSF